MYMYVVGKFAREQFAVTVFYYCTKSALDTLDNPLKVLVVNLTPESSRLIRS